MRRVALVLPVLAPVLPVLALSGCAGFGEFLDHTFSPPGANPNIPMADSLNVRRALGAPTDAAPLTAEPGNIWPGPQAPDPTLADIQSQQNTEESRGFPPTAVPGAQPGLPDHRQPRPLGSSTPPGDASPGLSMPAPGPTPPPPRTSVPGAGPQGRVIPTPSGPAVDTGGTSGYRQLGSPRGGSAIMVPNGNGTSTIIHPDGSVETVPTAR